MDSDTSDTSVYDTQPVSRQKTSIYDTKPGSRKKTSIDDTKPGSSEERDEVSINRSHLLAALRILKKNLQAEPSEDQPKKKLHNRNIGNICSLDLSIPTGAYTCRTTPIRLLMYTLTNSIHRHDWSTAARVVQTMMQIHMCNNFVYRTVFTVLFNHPQTDGETIKDFLSQVLNLRTRPEQLKFLQKLFFLPDDLNTCTDYADRFVDEESDSPDEN